MKKIVVIMIGLVAALSLGACHHREAANTILVGTIAGPETTLMEVAKQVAQKRYGLNVKIITFSDYTTPNRALSDGSIDANMFQHLPYLQSQIKAHGYSIVSIGKTFIYPMGIYSTKLKSLKNVPHGAKVAIPNDPSNEARALILLQKAGLIKLKASAGFNATPLDIVSNPKGLKFIPLQAAQLARSLDDVTLAAINTNYAMPAGLSPAKDALFVEGPNSPYANIVAVLAKNRDNKKALELVQALHSQAVLAVAKKIFGDGAIPAWSSAPKS